jgi:hypothetical protein
MECGKKHEEEGVQEETHGHGTENRTQIQGVSGQLVRTCCDQCVGVNLLEKDQNRATENHKQ